MSFPLKDVYQNVTNTIIAALETGTPPWVHPWTGTADRLPANLFSGHRYRGINVLLLNMTQAARGYPLNRWLSYQQAKNLGGSVRKGEHGTSVVFFKMLEVTGAKAEAGKPGSDARVIPLLRSFTVFNEAQVDGLPESLMPVPTEVHEWQACDAAEAILAASGASIQYGGSQAFYAPSKDIIQLPERSSFVSAPAFYQVALHELTHWTGAEPRCNRTLQGRQHIEAYAFEELVAEMGAAFLTDHCGLPGVLQHASYIESWLKALRNDKRLIFSAASLAQKAADYLLPPPAEEVAVMQVPVTQALAA
jgi:antirestriction protein ArdC